METSHRIAAGVHPNPALQRSSCGRLHPTDHRSVTWHTFAVVGGAAGGNRPSTHVQGPGGAPGVQVPASGATFAGKLRVKTGA